MEKMCIRDRYIAAFQCFRSLSGKHIGQKQNAQRPDTNLAQFKKSPSRIVCIGKCLRQSPGNSGKEIISLNSHKKTIDPTDHQKHRTDCHLR